MKADSEVLHRKPILSEIRLLLVEMIIGYEWLVSGVAKRVRGGCLSGNLVMQDKELVRKLKVGPIFLLLGVNLLLLFLPKKLEAVPQFARRYNLKCSACHTIVPVLNKQGYLFKRLGYRLPPALEAGTVAPSISDLVRKEPEWSLTNNGSLAVADFSFSAEHTTSAGTSPSSTGAFEVGAWNAYFGGWIPDTNFFYYTEFDIVTGGSTNPVLSNAYFGYSGGNARSSWYLAGGREHLQIGEGTRAAQVYSLLPDAPVAVSRIPAPQILLLTNLQWASMLATHGLLAATREYSRPPQR